MSSKIKLTPVEWEIMEAIWSIQGSPSIRDVLEYAYPNGEKAYTSVQTIMNILEKKGLLKKKKIGLVYFYKPLITRKNVIKHEISNFTSRIFNGSVTALTNFIVNHEDISLEELSEIKKLIDKKEDELKGKND